MSEEPSSSFDDGLKDTNLMFPEVNKVDDELLQFSAESDKLKIENLNTSDDELLQLPNYSGVLDLSKSQESLEKTSKEKKDPLTGEENNPVAEIAPLVDETSDGVIIQRRSGNSSDPGNNRRKAYDTGTLDGNEYYSDSVSRRDRKDFYKFSVNSRGRVKIDLSDMSDNADLYLHNSRGKAIKRSRRGGSVSESISRILNPGDYYVQVKSRSKWDSTDYDLELNFSELAPDYAGNNRRKARDLGSISSSESYNDFVGKGDRNDFYTFTFNGERDVDISLAGLSDNADLHLWKQGTRGVVGRSTNSGSSSESINQSLGAGTYYLRVKSKGGAGSNYSLSLEADEREEPPPPPPNYYINVTSPNIGGTWEPGDTINIGWSDNISENVKIDLYKGGIFQSTINSSTESDGSDSWTIPTDLTAGTDYNIKIASTTNSSVYDFGDSNFTVAEPDFITVTTPNVGGTWEPGDTINIGWSDNISENVKIDLYKGGIFQSTINSSTESDGSDSWTIPTDLTAGTDYNIKIASTTNSSVYDFGDSNFTVAEPDFITVTAPNIGGTWEPGDTINIGWSDNISENVKIDLYKGGIFQSTINSSTESNGSYSWTIPADLTAGTDYNIKIASTTNNSVYDLGDRYFTIKQGIIEEPPANERAEWQGWVSKWDASSGAPSPVNVNENTGFELVGKLNLGSNIREIFDDGRHGINNADWGLGSVKAYYELPTDNFLVKGYTEVDLEGGQTYEFEAKGDDGYQIWLKNLDTNEWRWVTPENEWQTTVGQTETDKFTHTIPGDKGGRYYVGFFHYEDGGEAYFGLNWKEEPVYEEEVSGSDWRGSFYRLDGNPPSTNFHENEANKLAVLNLGSGSSKEFRGDWGSGSPRAEYIPSDNFAVRSYTHAYFENGKQYEFNVSADDGYQIFAKQHGTNEWFDVTTKNEWSTDAYNGKTISHTWAGPTGNYDLHFQYYEITGDAYFNLDWNEVPIIPSNPALAKLLNGELTGSYIDTDNGYPSYNPYQCVDLVKYATGKYVTTSNWKRGANVMSSGNISVGTGIATFLGPNGAYNNPVGGKYVQHTGIFAGYGTENGVPGFYIWDQNWPSGSSVSKHFITAGGSLLSNADNYHVIEF